MSSRDHDLPYWRAIANIFLCLLVIWVSVLILSLGAAFSEEIWAFLKMCFGFELAK